MIEARSTGDVGEDPANNLQDNEIKWKDHIKESLDSYYGLNTLLMKEVIIA